MIEWKHMMLSQITTKVTDGAHHSPAEYTNGVPMFSVKDMREQGFSYENPKTISQEDFQLLVNSGCQPEIDDVLIAKDGSVLKHIFKVKEKPNYVLLSSIAIVRPNKEFVDPSFLVYAIKEPSTKDFILTNFVGGSGVPRIVLKDFKQIELAIPDIKYQSAIASILSSLDNKIDLLHRQNATLEKMAETLFRQWFVEEAKEEWEMGKLGDEFDFVMGASPPGESYNEQGNGIPMYQGNADFGFRFPTNRVFTTDPKRFAQEFDTLISVRAPVGEQNMANEICCIGRGVAAFRFKKDDSFYTYTYYKMKSLMNEIKQFNQTGTVFGSISKSDFESIDILLPNQETVKKFQGEVKPIDDKVITNTTQIRTLTAMRDTLLPKLMSGEVRVEI